MISWSLRAEDGGALQPDGLITQLKELFPDLREKGGMQETERQTEPVTPRAALDGLGQWLKEMKNGAVRELPQDWMTALVALLHSEHYGQAARQMLTEILPAEEMRKLAKETARRLFMTDRLSVSRLEQFASCPYRHFIDYGLRPVKQEDFTLKTAMPAPSSMRRWISI